MGNHCDHDFKQDYRVSGGEKLPWSAMPGSSARAGGIPWEPRSLPVIGAADFP